MKDKLSTVKKKDMVSRHSRLAYVRETYTRVTSQMTNIMVLANILLLKAISMLVIGKMT